MDSLLLNTSNDFLASKGKQKNVSGAIPELSTTVRIDLGGQDIAVEQFLNYATLDPFRARCISCN